MKIFVITCLTYDYYEFTEVIGATTDEAMAKRISDISMPVDAPWTSFRCDSKTDCIKVTVFDSETGVAL